MSLCNLTEAVPGSDARFHDFKREEKIQVCRYGKRMFSYDIVSIGQILVRKEPKSDAPSHARSIYFRSLKSSHDCSSLYTCKRMAKFVTVVERFYNAICKKIRESPSELLFR